MNALTRLKLGARLATGFGILILLSVITAAIGVGRINAVREVADRLGTRDAELVTLTQGWLRAIESNTARTWVVFFATDAEVVKRVKGDMQETVTEQTARLKRLDALITTDDKAKQLIAEITAQRNEFQAMRNALMKRRDAGEDVGGEVIAKVFPAAQQYLGAVRTLVDYQSAQMETTRREAEAAAQQGTWVLAAGCALAALAGIGLAVAIARSITVPVRAAHGAAEAIAAGDLSARLDATSNDEIGQLMQAMARMAESLRQIVGTVRAASDSIATGASEIATGNADLSQRTEEQASNLQQTASSMEELSSTVRNNADTANAAKGLAEDASRVARQGGEAVAQVVGTMEAITTSSRKISDIIGTIDGIAFQTNILALNAAVEAARAGEQGRGFAVVAGEVRLLAQRSAEAAKEIKTLINDSVEKVETGSRQVADAGRTMDDIVAQVRRVNDLITEISSATSEQTTGIGQVSDAVQQLDQVTQQNAALVEESAAAADSLNQQASKLVEAVSVFRV
ncbi:MAG TPA: methyl-accepting chemotaxis protein [Roseateles sp.]